MKELKYSMHNILLQDGRETMPGKPVLADTPEVKRMIYFAKSSFPQGAMVIDLGAGEGGYSIAFARAGFKVIAIEPRRENIDKIKYARQKKDDIVIFQYTIEEFLDEYIIPKGCLVLCLGLLYHLPNPALMLSAIAKRSTALMLSTHYAVSHHWQYDRVGPAGSWILKRICKRFPFLFRQTHYGLSRLTLHDGHLGRWYPEYNPGRINVQSLTRSSFHNHQSFWLTLNEIEDIIKYFGLMGSYTDVRIKDQGITGYYKK